MAKPYRLISRSKSAHAYPLLTKTGFPLPLVELDIVDLAGAKLPRDGTSVGEIVVRAPWCTQGYVKDPERSEALWKDGRLHTGDLAHQDPEGYIHITDRKKLIRNQVNSVNESR